MIRMTEAVLLQEIPVVVDRAEVTRSMGYPRGRPPTPAVEERLALLWPVALAALRPRGAFRLVTGKETDLLGIPDPTDPVALGLCTIGPGLEEEERRSGEAGEVLDALVLGAVGSVAVEACADALDSEVCAAARRLELAPGRRVSPGYGRWDLRRQKELFALLPAEEVGVHLTEGFMMLPRKSVSFAVRFPPPDALREERGGHRCATCRHEGCIYRDDRGVR